MNESKRSALPNQDVGPPLKRRLSILDLMLAMAAFALAMGLRQNSSRLGFDLNPNDPFWSAVFYFDFVLFAGLTFFGVMLLLRRRLQAPKQHTWHPGHLLLITQFLMLASIAAEAILVVLIGVESRSSWDKETNSYFLIFNFAVPLLAFFIALIGAFTWRWGWSWVVSWALLTLLSLSTLGTFWLILAVQNSILPNEAYEYLATIGFASACLSVLAVLLVCIAMMIDLRKGTPRDAAHWIGIVCWFGLSIGTYWLMMIAIQFVDAAELFGR